MKCLLLLEKFSIILRGKNHQEDWNSMLNFAEKKKFKIFEELIVCFTWFELCCRKYKDFQDHFDECRCLNAIKMKFSILGKKSFVNDVYKNWIFKNFCNQSPRNSKFIQFRINKSLHSFQKIARKSIQFLYLLHCKKPC